MLPSESSWIELLHRQFLIVLASNNNYRKSIIVFSFLFILFGFPLLCLVPSKLEYSQSYRQFLEKVAVGGFELEMPLTDLCWLLAQNKYIGQWQASIKRSEYLEAERGKIEISTSPTHSNQTAKSYNKDNKGREKQSTVRQAYKLFIRVYDGFYRDNSFYDISLDLEESKMGQEFNRGQLFYETTDPLIGLYRVGQGFHFQEEQILYVDKVKFKVKAHAQDIDYTGSAFPSIYSQQEQISLIQSSIRIQFLLSSEYSLNIVSKSISPYSEVFHTLLFMMVVTTQLCLQNYGLTSIYVNVLRERECGSRYSLWSFIAAFGLDVVEGAGLLTLGIASKQKLILLLPLLAIWWGSIIFLSMRVILLLYRNSQNYEEHSVLQYSNPLFHDSSNKLTFKIYGFCILLTLSCYLLNLSYLYSLVSFVGVVAPQIVCNYLVGHHLKKSMKYFMLYALPRYGLLGYTRLYQMNIFDLQTDVWLCVVCYGLLFLQLAVVWVQVKYGVRSILPRILHPKEFKYFMSQPEAADNVCSICLISLNESPNSEDAERTQSSSQQSRLPFETGNHETRALKQMEEQEQLQELELSNHEEDLKNMKNTNGVKLMEEDSDQETGAKHHPFLNQILTEEDKESEQMSARRASLSQRKLLKRRRGKTNAQKDLFNNVVLTPCGHKFHIECLVKWMETRLQCPNCRTLLPPIEDYK